MQRPLRFRLNTSLIEITEREETVSLDWLRRARRLTGTKEGCREGDCGACMVLLGERSADLAVNAGVRWRGALSCLLALGELDGRHLVTVEGIAANGLTPVMEALLDEGASQCGFCSPGFVMSLTGYLVGGGRLSIEGAVRAVEGNLCRCTGYASIERAAARLVEQFAELPDELPERLKRLAEAHVIPLGLASLMTELPRPASTPFAPREPGLEIPAPLPRAEVLTLGGGTDYFVRNPDPQPEEGVDFVDHDPSRRLITREGATITLGASVTVQEFFESTNVRDVIPGIERYERDFASLPIRTRATLAGNISNASPIGDMTAVLLALGASVRIRAAGTRATARLLALDRFFLSYRRTALKPGEQVDALLLPVPEKAPRISFTFEKVAKRAHLDIASVNSACLARADRDGRIMGIAISAGGVAPVPMRLAKCEAFLRGKLIDRRTAREAAQIASQECSPIDDVRGSAVYRRELLGRFILAHLAPLVPEREQALLW